MNRSDSVVNLDNGFLKIRYQVLFVIIIISPFSSSELFSWNLVGIPGLKIYNLLMLALAVIWLFYRGSLFRYRSKWDFNFSMCWLAYFLLIIIAHLRALMNFDELLLRYVGEFPVSGLSYFLSYGIKPLLYIVVVLYVGQILKKEQDFELICKVLLISAFIFALSVIYMAGGVSVEGLNRSELVKVFGEGVGLHYNDVGTILMLALPISFNFMMQRYKYSTFIFVVLLIALFMTMSRGALVGAVVGIIYTAFYSGSVWLRSIVYISVSALVVLGFMGGVFSILGAGERFTFDELLSGRFYLMWLPLWNEFSESPVKLLFGLGQFGMVMSDSYVTVFDFYQANHAHNAIINLIVESGLFALVFIIVALIKIMQPLKFAHDGLTVSAKGSVLAYMIACMFGRNFFPETYNLYFFLLVVLIVTRERLILKNANY